MRLLRRVLCAVGWHEFAFMPFCTVEEPDLKIRNIPAGWCRALGLVLGIATYKHQCKHCDRTTWT
jgi:hypothetical protein